MSEDAPAGPAGGDPDGRAPMMETDALTRRYRRSGPPALRDVSLSVARGEIVGVVGRSGSGKTTLLRLVAGLEVPDGGTVRLAGRAVSGPGAWVPPEERPLGMLFQEGALFPHLDVADNVEFGLRGLGRTERRRRRDDVLRLVGLERHGERYPHQLSGGERRRVALARALAPRPELVLLDEPFTGLDESLTSRLRAEVGRILRDTGTTALVVLHDTDEVLPLADRIGVLSRGRLVQTGRPDEVYARPRSEYVARLFGPVNVLSARRGERGELASPGSPGADGGAASREALACYRPEDLEIGPPGRFPVAGRVVEVGYRGDRVEVRIRLREREDGESAVLRVHRESAEAGPGPGDRVSLRAKPGRGHLLRETDRDPAAAE